MSCQDLEAVNPVRAAIMALWRIWRWQRWKRRTGGGGGAGGPNGAGAVGANGTAGGGRNGTAGGGVGLLGTTAQAFTFLTYTNNSFTWYKASAAQTPVTGQNFQRNLYYWADYNHSASTMKIYVSTTTTKPVAVNFSLTGFSFGSTSYYIGFGAATGGANANHILRSMKLTFT